MSDEADPLTGRSIAASEVVIAYLDRLVFEEREVGDRLPSEVQIAKDLGVSRLTVREGIRAFEARGVIQTSQGRRPIVVSPSGSAMGDYFRGVVRKEPRSMLDLLEFRQLVEGHSASAAATRSTSAQLMALGAAIDDMSAHVDDPPAFAAADLRFHRLLARASANSLIATILDQLSAAIRQSMTVNLEGFLSQGGDLASAVEAHRAVLASIKQGDADAAREAMTSHLRDTERDLIAGLAVLPRPK